MQHRTAVLLLDLQIDFLDAEHGKMPVPAADALRVIEAANTVLAGRSLPDALHVLVVNEFPAAAGPGNFLRRGAAIAGSTGARLDPRLRVPPSVPVFPKGRSSAFSNKDLEPYLQSQGVGELWIVGVMSEACVRATALAARKLGFKVAVAEAGIATNAAWKASFARWALRRGGVTIVPALPAMPPAT
jgi:nicotinamidase/pyrazinamidase